MSSIYCQPCEERRWDKSLPRERCTAPKCPNYKRSTGGPTRRAFKGIAGRPR